VKEFRARYIAAMQPRLSARRAAVAGVRAVFRNGWILNIARFLSVVTLKVCLMISKIEPTIDFKSFMAGLLRRFLEF